MTVESTLTQVTLLVNSSRLITFYHMNKLYLYHFRSNCHFCPLHYLYFILQKSCSCSIHFFDSLKKRKDKENSHHWFTAQRPKIFLLPVCWLPKALFASRICSRLWFCVLCAFLLSSQPFLSCYPLLMHYIFSDESPFFFSSLCSITRRQFLLILPLFQLH